MSDGLIKKSYHKMLQLMAACLGAKKAKTLDARIRFNRKLDLENPVTLADKISWIEFNEDQTIPAKLTDKFEVREYIKEKGFGDILIPLIGGPWTKAEDIPYDDLPDKFVLKATHGCEMNLICKDKSSLSKGYVLGKASSWITSDYARACIEPHYQLIPHRVYGEALLDKLADVIDYKFHCINGNPEFILVCSNREQSLKLNLYDTDWRPIEGLQGSMANSKEIERPARLERMLEISKALAQDFDFVRIDLYEMDKQVLFGEMTFSPAAGVFPYFTDEFIEKYGKTLTISE